MLGAVLANACVVSSVCRHAVEWFGMSQVRAGSAQGQRDGIVVVETRSCIKTHGVRLQLDSSTTTTTDELQVLWSVSRSRARGCISRLCR